MPMDNEFTFEQDKVELYSFVTWWYAKTSADFQYIIELIEKELEPLLKRATEGMHDYNVKMGKIKPLLLRMKHHEETIVKKEAHKDVLTSIGFSADSTGNRKEVEHCRLQIRNQIEDLLFYSMAFLHPKMVMKHLMKRKEYLQKRESEHSRECYEVSLDYLQALRDEIDEILSMERGVARHD